jgi:hypothetical protein
MYKRFFAIPASGILVLGFVLCGPKAIAQSDRSGGHMHRGQHMSPDQQLQRLDQALNLSDEQKNQIRPILEDRSQKMQSLHSDSSLSQEDKRSKMRSIFEDSNGKIRAVLNDDQKQKFDQMQQQKRERMQKHQSGTDNN